MGFTSADLDAVNAALANGGVAEIRHRDRLVRYRTAQELLQVKAVIEAELNASAAKPPRQVRFSTDNGFGRCE